MDKNKIMGRLTISVTLIVLGICIMEWQSFSPLHAVAGQSTYIAMQKNDPTPGTNRAKNRIADSPIENSSAIPETPSEPAVLADQDPPSIQAPAANKPTSTKPQAPKPALEAKPTPAPARVAAVSCSGEFVQELLCLLNEYRASKNLGKVSGNAALSQVALGHSKWMSENNIFSHTGVNGSRLLDRCKAAGTICRAENLAQGVPTAKEVLSMWKNSPGHNANLLGDYTIIGLGLYDSYTTLLLN
jgi:uncharacterized protein YkwD